MAKVVVRKAAVADGDRILQLVNELATQQIMLPRAPASVIEHIRDFAVVTCDGAFAGCGALQIAWSDLAEVRSLAIDPTIQHKGLGRQLVDFLVAEAEQLGIARLFAFTYVPGFFEKLGFSIVEHSTLPHKVFADCIHCPKFHACDEIAMERVLHETANHHERGPLSLPLPVRVPGR